MALTKPQIEALIDQLGKKYFVADAGESVYPILIGDVLAKYFGEENLADPWGYGPGHYAQSVVSKWIDCGADKSLQQIIAESGWRKYCLGCDKDFIGEWCTCGDKCENTERLKFPEARALFELLGELFPEKSNS